LYCRTKNKQTYAFLRKHLNHNFLKNCRWLKKLRILRQYNRTDAMPAQ
jgi:hypothetical protein